MTPLMFASSKGYDEIVNYLTLRTKDLNEEDSNSLTILMQYLFKKDFKMSSKLIVRGASVNYVNRNGNTALHLCVENGLVDAVLFLLKKGADPHIMDLAGEDACDKAKKTQISL
jgi:ankyrin repeat protein